MTACPAVDGLESGSRESHLLGIISYSASVTESQVWVGELRDSHESETVLSKSEMKKKIPSPFNRGMDIDVGAMSSCLFSELWIEESRSGSLKKTPCYSRRCFLHLELTVYAAV